MNELFDTADVYPLGMVLNQYTTIYFDKVDLAGAEFLNVGEVSGSAVVYLNVEVGGETVVYYLEYTGSYGGMDSYPLPPGTSSAYRRAIRPPGPSLMRFWDSTGSGPSTLTIPRKSWAAE